MQTKRTHSTLLREFADWLDAHPESHADSFPTPDGLGKFKILDARAQTAADMAANAKAIGGRWEKVVDDSYFWLRQEILPGLTYCLYQSRDAVCEAVVVGQEKVAVPDPDAPLVEVERDVVEWRCPESLMGAAA